MSKSNTRSPRDRLIETARKLFLSEGVPQTGINTVTAKADVARMTLYNNFASKEDLVLAVFEQEAALRREAIQAAQASLSDPAERVLALFDVARDLAAKQGFRGCAFINLAIEAAAPDSALHALAKRHKVWILDNIRAQLDDGDRTDADTLARQVAVLWDGGVVGAFVHQSDEPIRTAQNAARVLLREAVT